MPPSESYSALDSLHIVLTYSRGRDVIAVGDVITVSRRYYSADVIASETELREE